MKIWLTLSTATLIPFIATAESNNVVDANTLQKRYQRCDALTLAKPPQYDYGSHKSLRKSQPAPSRQAIPADSVLNSPAGGAIGSKGVSEHAPAPRANHTTLYGGLTVNYQYRNSNGTNEVKNTETYGNYPTNPVKNTADEAISTMSIDVDTGSYSNIRRFLLKDNRLPPHDAVRLEEMVNYFDYHYALPQNAQPFALNFNVIDSPWQSGAKLLRIGLQAKDVDKAQLPPANLAFLIDTSGSMHSPDKLALAQKSVCYFAANLRKQDTLSIVTYAGYTTELLPPTKGNQFDKIYKALSKLSAHGSTAGESAIRMGYKAVAKRFNPKGINRVLLATDGDFNVGISDFEQLKSLVADKRKTGISLTTLGFGTGNYKDQTMEQLADVGNGNYSYIDNLDEAKKVLTRQLSSTLATVAKDVKLQIEFNPTTVKEYRLVGYENRVLKNEDFNNDRVDAGDIGAGHNVTAFYEIIPQGQQGWLPKKRYQKTVQTTGNASEYAWLKLRYKPLGSENSVLMETPIPAQSVPLNQADTNARFAIAIASFAQALKGGEYNGNMQWQDIIQLAESAMHPDSYHLRSQAVEMMNKASELSGK